MEAVNVRKRQAVVRRHVARNPGVRSRPGDSTRELTRKVRATNEKVRCGIAWMGIIRAECLCGEKFKLDVEDAKGKTAFQTCDMLLDLFLAHEKKP